MTPRGIAAAALVVLLAGCGYKGPLMLPEPTGPVIIRPAPGAEPAPAAGTPGESAPSPGPGTANPPQADPKNPTSTPPAPTPEGMPTGG